MGENTPPGSDFDFSSSADVKHVYIRNITVYSKGKGCKGMILPL